MSAETIALHSKMSAETIDRMVAELSSENKKMKCLFMDFDGTIAELVPRPADASLSDSMRCCIEMLAETSHVHVCIVSGRNMDFLREKVTNSKINLCGEHGLKIEMAQTGHIFEHRECNELRKKYKELEQQLASDLAVYTGAVVENKGSSLTIHVRDLQSASESEHVIELCSQRIKAIGFRPRRAHLALEAVASTTWNKGVDFDANAGRLNQQC
jgi:trehalose-phosphatase